MQLIALCVLGNLALWLERLRFILATNFGHLKVSNFLSNASQYSLKYNSKSLQLLHRRTKGGT